MPERSQLRVSEAQDGRSKRPAMGHGRRLTATHRGAGLCLATVSRRRRRDGGDGAKVDGARAIAHRRLLSRLVVGVADHGVLGILAGGHLAIVVAVEVVVAMMQAV